MVGGKLLDYTCTLTSPTVTVIKVKCLFNSVVLIPKEKCATANVKHFYLNNDLPDPEYMKMHIYMIPDKICNEYNINDFVDSKSWVYIKTYKDKYRLRQIGIITNQ